ncbi:MAG TPA: PepSY domain-containing protein [Caulobacteraceae bacterium]|nr:PepSY domain-containing protein [Caulobacteraceae bacterium]
MRSVHRFVSVCALLAVAFLSASGVVLELIDLRALLVHAPPISPDMKAIRADFAGPGQFGVITAGDYAAESFPDGFDPTRIAPAILSAARGILGHAPIDYLELRMIAGKPTGLARSGRQLVIYDAATGRAAVTAPPPDPAPQASLRNFVAPFHAVGRRLRPLQAAAIGVLSLAGLGICIRQACAWLGHVHRPTDDWRALRYGWIALALALAPVALSGAWLTFESLWHRIYLDLHTGDRSANAISPMDDGAAPQIWRNTLHAFRANETAAPLKVVRVRVFAGMPQGVVIAGAGEDTRQEVFDGRTGRPVSDSEQGFPPTGYPLGWRFHQWARRIHRGDYLGLPGRFLQAGAGVGLLIISISLLLAQFRAPRRTRAAPIALLST